MDGTGRGDAPEHEASALGPGTYELVCRSALSRERRGDRAQEQFTFVNEMRNRTIGARGVIDIQNQPRFDYSKNAGVRPCAGAVTVRDRSRRRWRTSSCRQATTMCRIRPSPRTSFATWMSVKWRLAFCSHVAERENAALSDGPPHAHVPRPAAPPSHRARPHAVLQELVQLHPAVVQQAA